MSTDDKMDDVDDENIYLLRKAFKLISVHKLVVFIDYLPFESFVKLAQIHPNPELYKTMVYSNEKLYVKRTNQM